MNDFERPILAEFGKALMEEVRDETISHLTRLVSGKLATKHHKDLYQQLEKQSLRPEHLEIVGLLLTEAVDSTIANLLRFLDARQIGVLFPANDGRVYDIQAIGDGLVGRPYGAGWIKQFSRFKALAGIERLN